MLLLASLLVGEERGSISDKIGWERGYNIGDRDRLEEDRDRMLGCDDMIG